MQVGDAVEPGPDLSTKKTKKRSYEHSLRGKTFFCQILDEKLRKEVEDKIKYCGGVRVSIEIWFVI